MKAIAIDNFNESEEIKIRETPIRDPGPGEIQIENHYAGVNPVDWKIKEGWLKNRLSHQFPLILGWDASGVVSKVGEGVTDFQLGDEVYTYARKPVVQYGTYCEYLCVKSDHVALKPETCTFAEAASIPLVALTAWQSLFVKGNLTAGQTIFIHAGAGGVGSLAIQFAKEVGAKIYTTASLRNHDYVRSLGADVAIDYTKGNIEMQLKENEPDGVDFVFDCVGGKTLEDSPPLLKKGGTLITICNFDIDPSISDRYGIKYDFVFVEPNGEQLKQIASLFDKDKVKPPNITEYPIEKATLALDESKKGHTRGKIVLKIR